MIKKLFIISGLSLVLIVSGFGLYANALKAEINGSATIVNPLGPNTDLMTLIGKLLQIVAEIGAVVCIFFIIYSGFLFIKAQGDPAELTKAKSVFMWSVIGAAVLLGASVIADMIVGTVDSVIGR